MKHGTMLGVGLALGAVLGAVIVEGYRPAQEAICKSKRMIKDKMDQMSNKNSF